MSEFGYNFLAIKEVKSFKVAVRIFSGIISITLSAILIYSVFCAVANIWWFNSFEYIKYLIKPHIFNIEGREYSLPKDFYLVSIDSSSESESRVNIGNYTAWSIDAFIPKNSLEIDSASIQFSNKVFWLWVHQSFSNRFNGEESRYMFKNYKIDMYHDVWSGANYLTNVLYYIQIPQIGMRFLVYCNQTDDTRVLSLIKSIAFPSIDENFVLIKKESRYQVKDDHLKLP